MQHDAFILILVSKIIKDYITIKTTSELRCYVYINFCNICDTMSKSYLSVKIY